MARGDVGRSRRRRSCGRGLHAAHAVRHDGVSPASAGGPAAGRVSFGSAARLVAVVVRFGERPAVGSRTALRHTLVPARPGRAAAARVQASACGSVTLWAARRGCARSYRRGGPLAAPQGLRVRCRRVGLRSWRQLSHAAGPRCGSRARRASALGARTVGAALALAGAARRVGSQIRPCAPSGCVRAGRVTGQQVGLHARGVADALVVPSVARWDTWDWPLRSNSEAAPKDREGRRPVREHQATAGRSENLKVGSSVSHGETTKRMG